MRNTLLVLCLLGAAAAWGEGETATSGEAPADHAVSYTERHEQTYNKSTGKVEIERVLEFSELEILPDVAKPVSFIIPRAKPDFDEISLTIYNNEPPPTVPDELKRRYYRRVPVNENAGNDAATRREFGEEEQNGKDPPAGEDTGESQNP